MSPLPVLPAMLLVGALAAAWAFLHLRMAPREGAGRYPRWMTRAVAAFVLPTLLALAGLGRIDALWMLPPEFAGVRAALPTMVLADIICGALGGVLLGLMVAAIRAWRGGRPIGRPGALTPRYRSELGWSAAAALVAGVTEEPFFRLLLPLLVALVTGSAAAGFVLSTLVFGAMHRYQGWRGMIATTVFGGVMAGVYLISGTLWLVIVIHALVDLNGLVVWPALSPGWLSDGRNEASRPR